MTNWYEAHIEKYIPQYAFFSFLCCFAVNCIVYWATQFIRADAYHYDFTTEFDRMVPFQPWWVLIYVLSFLFWVVNYSLVSKRSPKEFWFKFASADMLARVVCGVIFVVIPTTNVRPELADGGFWNMAMGLIYSLDEPFNLFPSIHCLASWMCYIGIRRNKDVSTGYKVFSFVFALLICASTQFTKQHYIVDVVGGLILAELCFFVTTHTDGYLKVMAIFDKLTDKVFGKKFNEE